MTDVEPGDIFERIRWALRHYAWAVAVLMAAALALGWFAASAADDMGRYRATSLVVANSLDVPASHLPRFAVAVFDSGAVAEAVGDELGLSIDPQEFVPSHISMEPVADSIAFLVHGHSDDAQSSVDLANAAADHFVRELNRAGPGVGTFSVQDVARVPQERVTGPSREVAIAISGVAGMLLAVVLVGFIVWLRRPLITADEVVAAFGLPLLGIVSVGRNGGLLGSNRAVTSHPLVVRTVTQRLESTPHDGFVLLGEAGSKKARRALAIALEQQLRPSKTAKVSRIDTADAPMVPDGRSHTEDRPPRAARARRRGPRPPSHSSARLFPSSLYWAQTGDRKRPFRAGASVPVVLTEDWAAGRTDASSWGVVVVTEQGAPSRKLSEVVAEWRSNDTVGVVMLRRRHALNKGTRRAGEAARPPHHPAGSDRKMGVASVRAALLSCVRASGWSGGSLRSR